MERGSLCPKQDHPRPSAHEASKAQGQGSKPWPDPNLANMNASRNANITAEYVALRSKLWPEIKEEDLWPRTNQKGFTIMPRTMPLILQIMDAMAKGKPVSRAYLDL